jgi:filamentous hemagglutinin
VRSHSPPLHQISAIASITTEKINDTVGDAEKVTGQMAKLVPGEGTVATYGELNKARRRDDNLTAHHIPADAFMKAKVSGYTRNKGISIWMEQPYPGAGGRHRQTLSYGSSPDLSLSPRQALAREVWDVRSIYRQQGLYTPDIRRSLQQVINQNKLTWIGTFNKVRNIR